jgi:outer membrane protein assembly factor BamB
MAKKPPHGRMFDSMRAVLLVFSVVVSANAAEVVWRQRPNDVLGLRGPGRVGILPGITIDGNWSEKPPRPLWRQKVGPAWSGMIVVDNHVVTQEQRGEFEVVSCYDASTGKEIWAHQDRTRYELSMAGIGPRATPTFADGRIYSVGAKGLLNCLAAETGKVIWSHNLPEEAGLAADGFPEWGYSTSPLVVDGLVVVFAGGGPRSVLAYDASTGKLAWSCAGGKYSYSSPQVVTLHGKRQIVMHDDASLAGLEIADGTRLWEFPNPGEPPLVMLQPHTAGETRLVISAGGTTTMLNVKRDGEKLTAARKWSVNNFLPNFSDFVVQDGCIFGLSDGVLCCFDVPTGERLWKKGRLGHGQVLSLPAQRALLISNSSGELIRVSISREGYEELGRFTAITGKTRNGPVLVGNQLFVRSNEEMAAYEVSTNKSAAGNGGDVGR